MKQLSQLLQYPCNYLRYQGSKTYFEKNILIGFPECVHLSGCQYHKLARLEWMKINWKYIDLFPKKQTILKNATYMNLKLSIPIPFSFQLVNLELHKSYFPPRAPAPTLIQFSKINLFSNMALLVIPKWVFFFENWQVEMKKAILCVDYI